MSGTASRFQARFGYAPGLRVGQYPAAQPAAPVAPSLGAVGPTLGPAAPVTPMAAPVSAPAAAAPPVMAGTRMPDRLPYEATQDGAGGSAQGEYGGPGPSGIGSTGSVLGDIAGFTNEAGRAAGGLAGGPMGVVGLGFGAMASGLAAAFGAPDTAAAIARASGLPGVAPVAYDPNAPEGPGATVGEQVGIGSIGTPGLGVAPDGGYGTPGVSVKGDEFGAPTGGPVDSANKPGGISYGGDYGSGDKGGLGDNGSGDGSAGGSSAESSGGNGGEDGGSKGGDWMRGGYTGGGADGAVQPAKIAGRVHEGEVVIPAAQVQRYGLDPLLMLARGQVQPSRLSALLIR